MERDEAEPAEPEAVAASVAVADLDLAELTRVWPSVLDELANQCAAGDMVDCDLLYAEAETNSEAERYGATCGGRLETDQDCRQLVL